MCAIFLSPNNVEESCSCCALRYGLVCACVQFEQGWKQFVAVKKRLRGKVGQWVYSGTDHLNTRLLWHLFFLWCQRLLPLSCFFLSPLWCSLLHYGRAPKCLHMELAALKGCCHIIKLWQLLADYTWSVQGRWKGGKLQGIFFLGEGKIKSFTKSSFAHSFCCQ